MNEDELRHALVAIAGDTTPSPAAADRVDSVAAHRIRRHRLAVSALALVAFIGAVGILRAGQGSSVRTVPADTSTTTTAFGGPTVVAVTEGGAVRVVDARRGRTVRTLVQRGVNGGVDRSPDGATVYYADGGTGCANGVIHAVPADGSGPPTAVAEGTRPAVSPDGTRLAYWTRQTGDTGCDLSVVVRVLATGAEQRWTQPNGYFAGGHIDRIAWSADGRRLLFTRTGNEHNGPPVLDLTRPGPLQVSGPTEPFGTALAWHPRRDDMVAMVVADGGLDLPPGVATVALVQAETGSVASVVFTTARPPVVLDFDPSGENLAWIDDTGRLRMREADGDEHEFGDEYVAVAW